MSTRKKKLTETQKNVGRSVRKPIIKWLSTDVKKHLHKLDNPKERLDEWIKTYQSGSYPNTSAKPLNEKQKKFMKQNIAALDQHIHGGKNAMTSHLLTPGFMEVMGFDKSVLKEWERGLVEAKGSERKHLKENIAMLRSSLGDAKKPVEQLAKEVIKSSPDMDKETKKSLIDALDLDPHVKESNVMAEHDEKEEEKSAEKRKPVFKKVERAAVKKAEPENKVEPLNKVAAKDSKEEDLMKLLKQHLDNMMTPHLEKLKKSIDDIKQNRGVVRDKEFKIKEPKRPISDKTINQIKKAVKQVDEEVMYDIF